jgi:N-acetylmuramoyl-L-alanine amidase
MEPGCLSRSTRRLILAAPIWHPSENFGARRDVAQPDMVMLHYTAMTSAEGARDWLCNPEAQVSAHYVIAEDGRLWQLVAEEQRAWHAGAGAWGRSVTLTPIPLASRLRTPGGNRSQSRRWWCWKICCTV